MPSPHTPLSFCLPSPCPSVVYFLPHFLPLFPAFILLFFSPLLAPHLFSSCWATSSCSEKKGRCSICLCPKFLVGVISELPLLRRSPCAPHAPAADGDAQPPQGERPRPGGRGLTAVCFLGKSHRYWYPKEGFCQESYFKGKLL